jgi:hypothetical protein
MHSHEITLFRAQLLGIRQISKLIKQRVWINP